MKENISKIFLILYLAMLILSGFIPTTSGGLVGWFVIMGIFAILLILTGSKQYRICGIVALLIAIAAAIIDYKKTSL